MPPTVRRCLLCSSTSIRVQAEGRFVRTSCDDCGAELAVEFDPPHRPGVRALIERLDDGPDPQHGGSGTSS